MEIGKPVHAIAGARLDSVSEVLLAASLPARADQCGLARRMVAAVLDGRVVETETADAMSWAVAELFANGLDHHEISEGERLWISLTVRVGPGGQWLALSVADSGRGCLRPRSVSLDDEGGRGLNLVRRLGARITDEVLPAGYEVTAWVPENSHLRSRVCRCDCVAWGHQRDSVCVWTVAPEGLSSTAVGASEQMTADLTCGPCAERVELLAANIASCGDQRQNALSGSGQAR